jgi:hypothetical protein
MSKIYLVKSFPVNITNILHAILTSNAGDKLVGSCTYRLDKKFLKANYNELVDIFGTNIRGVDWRENIDRLRSFISNHRTNDVMIFGSYSDDQMRFLKDMMKDRIMTVGLNYTVDHYDFLLNNMVEYHCHENGGDLEQLKIEFEKQDLCPRKSEAKFDYVIDLEDLFDRSKMIDHCDRIGLPFTDDTLTFYNSWLDLNK